MNAILLSLLALGGAGGDYHVASDYVVAGDAIHGDAYDAGACDNCRRGHCHKHGHKHGMPQTCYDPPYGCYPGTRFNHRYPAFHGTYYRRPYNYRNVFDYPWHAEPHEPTSHFSYHVEGAEEITPPKPEPAAVLDSPLHRDMRAALDASVPAAARASTARASTSAQLRTLRR